MKLYSATYGDWHPLDVFFPTAQCVTVSELGQLNEPGILILHGGTDIQPSLYKRGRSLRTYDIEGSTRDSFEWELVKEARAKNILICGWCRGSQLLCAAAGGYLIQDITGHGHDHEVVTNEGEVFFTNSTHHQMQAPWNVPHVLLAHAKERKSKHYLDVNEFVEVPQEVEAVYYPELHGLAFQWHPETMSSRSPANKWLLKQVLAHYKEEFHA